MANEIIKLDSPERAKIVAEIRRQKPQRRSRPRLEREDTGSPGPWKFCVLGVPVGKPRMTQRDKWQKRPCVMKARAWADAIRAGMPEDLPPRARSLHVVAYMPMLKSFPKGLCEAIKGHPCGLKPDADNILKLILDALFVNDQCVSNMSCQKYFDDGQGPRVLITVER